jgi:TRAP-type C4-dicarboxylate transport system permease small subunit
MNAQQAQARPGWLTRITEALMALSLAGMVVAVFVNVVLRYGFHTGIVFYEELSRLLFVWLVCVGAVLASAEGKHLGFDMLTSRLKGVPAKLCWWASQALVVFVLLLVLKGSWEQVKAGLGSFSTVMGYPLALAAASTLVMAGGMLAVLAFELVRGRPVEHHDTDVGVE